MTTKHLTLIASLVGHAPRMTTRNQEKEALEVALSIDQVNGLEVNAGHFR